MIVHCKTLRPGDVIRGVGSRPRGAPTPPWVDVESVDVESPRGGRGRVTLTAQSADDAGVPRAFTWGDGYVWVARRARTDD